MLVAHARHEIGAALIRSAIALGPHATFLACTRRGVSSDTRFGPTHRGEHRADVRVLWIVLEGEIGIDGTQHRAPGALLLDEEGLLGRNDVRTIWLTTRGEPFTAIEVHVRDAHLVTRTHPAWLELDATTLAAAHTAIVSLLDGGEDVAPLLSALAAAGILAYEPRIEDPIDPLVLQMWRGVQNAYQQLGVGSTIKTFGGLLSLRSVERAIGRLVESYIVPLNSWREAHRYLRLRQAALLLSAPSLSIAEVARAVGFRHGNALANAFRDAGIPSPTLLREALAGYGAIAGASG